MFSDHTPLKLYLLDYGTSAYPGDYEAVVVAAISERHAREIHPSGIHQWDGRQWVYGGRPRPDNGWLPPNQVDVKLLGEADPSIAPGVVYSFRQKEEKEECG